MKFLLNSRSVLLIVLLTSLNMFGQKGNLDSLSNDLRESFQTRLDKYIQYEINQDWSKMFPLTTDYISDRKIPFLAEKQVNEEYYIKRRNSSLESDGKLLRFSLSGISLINGNANETEWLVDGCGEFKKGKNRFTLKTAINAVYYNNNWYFSDIRFLLKGIGKNQEIKCKIPKP